MTSQDPTALLRSLSYALTWTRPALLAGLLVLSAAHASGFQSTSPGRTAGTRGSGGGPTVNAPEINPKLLLGATVLLVGGLLILASRRRRVAGAESR